MALAMTLGATTAISQTLNFSGYSGGSTIEIQYATRSDFNFCVAPRYEIAAAAAHSMSQLNQNTTYYVRAREVTSAGAPLDWVSALGFRTAQTAPRDLTVPAVMIAPSMVVVPEPILQWQQDSVTVDGFPLLNLGYDAPVAWRSTSGAGTFAFYVRTAGQPVDTFALLMHNGPESGIFRIYGGATAGATTYDSGPQPLRASPNLPGRPGFHALVNLPAPVAHRWYVFHITATVPGGLFHAEHALLGLNRVTKNHSVDKVETPVDYGSFNRNRAGLPDRITGYRGRRVDFDISMLTELEYENNYADLGHRVGLTDPVFVLPNSKAGPYLHDRMLYGPIVGQKAVNPASPRYTRSFSVDSII